MSDTDSIGSSVESVSALNTGPQPTDSIRSDLPSLHHSSHPARQSSLSQTRPSNRPHDVSSDHHRMQERRDNIIALDRKRRLTGSAPDPGRRRRSLGSGPAHGAEEYISDEDHDYPANNPSQEHEVIDLTGTSPSTGVSSHTLRQASRTSSSSSRRYVVPHWQPDAEVSACPICKRQFTWLFRRHHCRKCGRVVCNECSPHRITIPRQFIVSPPDMEQPSSPDRSDAARRVDLIDLTVDTDNGTLSRRHPLDGGEKVRLCNPCVPDPQPEPLPNFPSSSETSDLPSRRAQPCGIGTSIDMQRHHTNILGQPSRQGHGAVPSFAVSTSVPHRGDLYSGRPRPSSLANPSSLFPAGLKPYAEYLRSTRTENTSSSAGSQPLPPLPSSMYGHGRYASVGSGGGFGADMYRRHRVDPTTDRHTREMGSAPTGHRSRRPRLNEEDICPVCRRALPPRGADGDETAREAHIMQCITSREPASGNIGEGSSSRPSSLHMVSFAASEKDCVREDGNAPECSICMVEYDPGDQLARLECFCKFHRECIVSWLSRKAECPVHKVSSMHY